MSCCDRCGSIEHLVYRLDGDGDGVEYLTELADRRGVATESTVVVLQH